MLILGRSDVTLKPGGVRIGTGDFYEVLLTSLSLLILLDCFFDIFYVIRVNFLYIYVYIYLSCI